MLLFEGIRIPDDVVFVYAAEEPGRWRGAEGGEIELYAAGHALQPEHERRLVGARPAEVNFVEKRLAWKVANLVRAVGVAFAAGGFVAPVKLELEAEVPLGGF